MEGGDASEKRGPGPPEWALRRAAAWRYLVITIMLVLAGFAFFCLPLVVAAAVFAYLERRSQGLPTFWWTVCVLLLGPLGYLLFIYKRSRPYIVTLP
jgi:hypothetical protein